MDENKLMNILNGNFESIPGEIKKSIRVFMSSTFAGKFSFANLILKSKNFFIYILYRYSC